jgi:DNA-binding YbaB/EbfC family protein
VFDALKNLGGLGEIFKQGKLLKEKMNAMQEELSRKEITADAGEGRVVATVNGKLELLKVRIDKMRIDISNTELLEDTVAAAVRAAQAKAALYMKQEMEKVAAEMGLPPGMLP